MSPDAAAFDTVHRGDGSSMSAAEFIHLPLIIRVRLVLDQATRFTKDGHEVERKAAMDSLRPATP